ncbi:MAG: preprotein translocase subunit SecY [Euryarchaeota archaeon]|nr:preprotein translocase subunit SecY [Euryarchaeota archaeon]
MGLLHKYEDILTSLPEVEKPKYALPFNDRIKWTGIILVTFFVLQEVPLLGLDPKAVDIFENMRAVIAGSFGSIMTLGIGPIVTASIILQILVGGKLVDLDLSSPRDKAIYQGTQKLLSIAFTVFEGAVMVLMGALPAVGNDPTLQMFLIAQLTLGGIMVIYMDEVVSKWGFGSGIGLFIAANVCSKIVIGSFNPLPATAGEVVPAGRIPAFIYMIMNGQTRFDLWIPILGTIAVFAAVVYAESMRVEIPLTYGRFRGARGRYPIRFIYASNIPVIFASIFLANVQLWARMLENAGFPILGHFAGNNPVSGIAYFAQRPRPLGSPDFDITVAVIYSVLLVLLAMLFSKFWVETAGMDTKTVARQLQSGGMQIPGFRGDIRIIEKVLDRYIPAVTLLGGAAVGLLAAFGDLTGCLGGGTGVLLTVGILYRLYEQMAQEQLFEVHPMLRKIMGGGI